MENEEKKCSLDISGPELVSLAGSLAICFANKYDKESLNSLRIFFQAVSSNISIIEFKGFYKKN